MYDSKKGLIVASLFAILGVLVANLLRHGVGVSILYTLGGAAIGVLVTFPILWILFNKKERKL